MRIVQVISKLNSFFQATVVLLLILASCANPVAPTGGPKDENPPVVVRSIPENLTTNFKGDQIILYFDEFINLKDIASQLIISPPVKEKPEFKIKGRSLIINFKEPWRDETTYNIFFGDAIVDITESNPISGYKFTFSTGDILDSMMVQGKLINAFNLTPVKSAYVMLYDTVYDSLPYKELPYYISRTMENGEFSLTNLRNVPYFIFGLTDINANYLYDHSNEEIAFLDTLITPWHEDKSTKQPPLVIGQEQPDLQEGNRKKENKKEDAITQDIIQPEKQLTDGLYDSITVDSLRLKIFPNDSIAIVDTIHAPRAKDSVAMTTDSAFLQTAAGKIIQLFQFREVDSTQKLLKVQLLSENIVSFQFKQPVKNINFDFYSNDSVKTVIGRSKAQDTLTMWLPGFSNDSILVEVSDDGIHLDSVEISVKPREKNRKNEKTPTLNFRSNIQNGRLKPTSPLVITFADPVERFNRDAIVLIEDSIILNDINAEFRDSSNRQLMIRYHWKQGTLYTFTLDDEAFTGIMGTVNDSTTISFMGLKEAETAKLTLSIDLPENSPYIIQLLDPKEVVLSEYRINEDLTLEIPYIMPGKYKLKAIDDRNGNGYWDTGKYLAGKQPERVIYFPGELEFRANWTTEETWKIPDSGK